MISKHVTKTDSIKNELDETFLYCKELGKGCIKKDFNTIELNNDYSMENVLNVLDNKSADELIALNVDVLTFEAGQLTKSRKLDSYVDTHISSLTDATSIDSFVKNMRSAKPFFDTDFTLQGFRQTLTNQNVLMPNNNSTKNLDVSTLFAAAYPNATMSSWQVKSTSTPTKGTVSLLGNTLKFIPTPMSYGDDTIEIEVTDSRGVIFELPVTFADIVANSAPTATDGTESGNTFEINWKTRLNVQDVDGDTVTATVSVQPTKGTVVLNGDTLTYKASENKSGSDSITLLLDDGKEGTTTAVLTITDIDIMIAQIVIDANIIACGYYHSIIVKNDGSIRGTGYNGGGQLGLGNTTDRTSWTRLSLTDVKSVVGGRYHSMILKNDGTVWVAGENNYGQLGLGDTTQRNSWTQISLTDVKSVDCGDYHSMLLKNDGTVWGTGYNGGGGQLGLGDTTNRNSWTQTSITDVKSVTCGNNHTTILKNDGTVWSTGRNNYGQLGLGDTTNRNSWTKTPLTDVKSVACGYEHLIILTNDDTIWVTGRNNYGQLGLGNTSNKYSWTQTSLTDVKSVVCGELHSMILKNDGTVWVTGRNNYGELGLGDTTERNIWTQTSLTDVTSIYCSELHSMILKNNGTVWVTGHNSTGALGLGDTTQRNSWTQSTSFII